MLYETLIKLSEDENIEVVEIPLPNKIKGLYSDDVIAVNKNLNTNAEKACILAEELGHHYTSSGNILNQSEISNRKQERRARAWGYKKLAGIIKLVNAYNDGIRNMYELSEYLGVTEDFVNEAIKYYREKYGVFHEIDDYIVYFEPFGVFKKF